MLSITVILALIALALAIWSVTSPPRPTLWVAVVLLCILELLRAGLPYATR